MSVRPRATLSYTTLPEESWTFHPAVNAVHMLLRSIVVRAPCHVAGIGYVHGRQAGDGRCDGSQVLD